MSKRLKHYLGILPFYLSLLFGASSASAQNDFEKGLDHMRDGNYAQAFCLWEPIARLGHPDAQFNLGWLYANGNGLNVDVNNAVYWWQQAANNGHLDAQFAIGLAYTTGEGIQADLDHAFRWFLQAGKSGHQDSRDIVKRLVLESGTDYYAQYPELYRIDWLVQYVEVSGEIVNIRNAPDTKANIVHKAKQGETFKKTGIQGDWVRIELIPEGQTESQTAWIYGKLVTTKSKL